MISTWHSILWPTEGELTVWPKTSDYWCQVMQQPVSAWETSLFLVLAMYSFCVLPLCKHKEGKGAWEISSKTGGWGVQWQSQSACYFGILGSNQHKTVMVGHLCAKLTSIYPLSLRPFKYWLWSRGLGIRLMCAGSILCGRGGCGLGWVLDINHSSPWATVAVHVALLHPPPQLSLLTVWWKVGRCEAVV